MLINNKEREKFEIYLTVSTEELRDYYLGLFKSCGIDAHGSDYDDKRVYINSSQLVSFLTHKQEYFPAELGKLKPKLLWTCNEQMAYEKSKRSMSHEEAVKVFDRLFNI